MNPRCPTGCLPANAPPPPNINPESPSERGGAGETSPAHATPDPPHLPTRPTQPAPPHPRTSPCSPETQQSPPIHRTRAHLPRPRPKAPCRSHADPHTDPHANQNEPGPRQFLRRPPQPRHRPPRRPRCRSSRNDLPFPGRRKESREEARGQIRGQRRRARKRPQDSSPFASRNTPGSPSRHRPRHSRRYPAPRYQRPPPGLPPPVPASPLARSPARPHPLPTPRVGRATRDPRRTRRPRAPRRTTQTSQSPDRQRGRPRSTQAYRRVMERPGRSPQGRRGAPPRIDRWARKKKDAAASRDGARINPDSQANLTGDDAKPPDRRGRAGRRPPASECSSRSRS